ncbi:hypothetical protein SAMD00019534_047030 [Acytostelium subglobosum LB1]|uniref:hypothetical protein n=1 Tax=Acytostelium subglobosum LB1 TaxID=1410327 RepID=UPI000644E9E1|nr:hypothetical protein SAMD00019534_047030 [Acytostelium subglobosum LB1]GAM21528.1 hypothetical protein SAMD00019534_047030 [Acytostelium subglobosum LB1]|eukprot:XP_012755647.1 hypothetical protein SAMD00019534_047030 [Acytostelium subglobosum LB1]
MDANKTMSIEREKRMIDLLTVFKQIKRNESIAKNMHSGRRTLIKRLNLMRGRFFYPATVHRRVVPSYCTLVRNTAINSLTEDEPSDELIMKKIVEVKKSMDMDNAKGMVGQLFQNYGMPSFQKAMMENGIGADGDDSEDDDEEDDDEEEEDDEQMEDDEDEEDDE